MFIKHLMTIDRDHEMYAHCNCTDCHNSYIGKLFGYCTVRYLMYGYTYCYIKTKNSFGYKYQRYLVKIKLKSG